MDKYENDEFSFLKEGTKKKTKAFKQGRQKQPVCLLSAFQLPHRKQDQHVNKRRIFVSRPLWERLDAGLVDTQTGPAYLVGSSSVGKGPLRLTVFLRFSAGP